jgi:TonB family protein
VIGFLPTLALGIALVSAAPAYAESSKSNETEVQVSKPAVGMKRIRYKAPEYPKEAVQAQLSGFVTIEFFINKRGEPTRLRVVEAQPAALFDHAVLSAAKRWRYRPLVMDKASAGTPTRAIVWFKTFT